MNNSSEVRNHWDGIGRQYQGFWRSSAQKVMSRWETDFIKVCVPTGRTLDILDLGIGNGRILEALVEKSDDKSAIYGLDISSKMVEYCKEKFAGNGKIRELKTLESNQVLDVFNKKFDLITSVRVIKYNENWEGMVAQLCGMLNEGGKLVFSMPNKDAITRFLRTNITYVRTNPSQIRKIAENNGMKVLEIRGFSRVPDLFYKIDNKLAGHVVIVLEKMFGFIFGKYFLGRELFYVLKK